MPIQKNKQQDITPFYERLGGDVKLYLGDVRGVLRKLPAQSVHSIVTSPPYWGLRDYGVAGQIGSEPSPDCGTLGQAQCGQCFVCVMVGVFREVRRVLRDDGTLWLNLGDTYANKTYSESRTTETVSDAVKGYDSVYSPRVNRQSADGQFRIKTQCNIPSGNIVGIPWRVALALQADGWILRQDIIWHKPSPMPESVTDRCTKAHEYIFLLCKQKPYYYDAEAIKEKSAYPGDNRSERHDSRRGTECNSSGGGGPTAETRNKRSIWTVSSQGYEGSHFATFPQKLIEPCILAGTPLGGTVLDPFVGSGTTVVVALQHWRKAIGIDLSEKYLTDNAIPRIEGACHDIPALAQLIRPATPTIVGKSLLKAKRG